MCYDGFRKQGLFVGSRVVEAGCHVESFSQQNLFPTDSILTISA